MSTFEKYTAEQRAAISDSLPGGASDELIERLEALATRYHHAISPDSLHRNEKPHATRKALIKRLNAKLGFKEEKIKSVGQRAWLSDARAITELMDGDPCSAVDVLESLHKTRPAKEPHDPDVRGFLMEVVAAWHGAVGRWPEHIWDDGLGIAGVFISSCCDPARVPWNRYQVEAAVGSSQAVLRIQEDWRKAQRISEGHFGKGD